MTAPSESDLHLQKIGLLTHCLWIVCRLLADRIADQMACGLCGWLVDCADCVDCVDCSRIGGKGQSD